ncbi:MAG: hypothetical protein DRJ40_01720 [Thermoprotei archaeon]|mgnify:CR=1 FL=1|nr:MAG: hypothetical protein DRJ40_01720 [Thermoprotei archaeon]
MTSKLPHLKLSIYGLRIRFVNREHEVRYLLELLDRRYAFPLAIYGPEGCGKTTLLKYLGLVLESLPNTTFIYVDALEQQDIKRALTLRDKYLWELVEDLIHEVPVGKSIALSIMKLIREYAQRRGLRGRKIVVAVDDAYEAIGLENVTRYTKSMYEWIKVLYEEFYVDSVLILLTTSEGRSKRVLSRHTYVHTYMIWNLPRKGFEELVEQFSPPHSTDYLWSLTGGNPRALIELMLMKWDVDRWISSIVESRIRKVLREFPASRLRAVIEDPDADPEVAEKLEDCGLMIELRRVMTISEVPERCPELGIGYEWAWQIPAYKYALSRVLK